VRGGEGNGEWSAGPQIKRRGARAGREVRVYGHRITQSEENEESKESEESEQR